MIRPIPFARVGILACLAACALSRARALDKAHGVRKFDDAEATQPTLAAEGRRFLSAMYVHEARAHELGFVGDALVEHRRRLIRPLAEQL